MTRRSGRVGALLALLGFILVFVSMPVAAADSKWFVCKYVGTPGVDERFQTGDNPISVGGGSLPDPVVVGTFFNDAQGRSFILAEDIGQPEPPLTECPPPDTGGSPTPSPSASPSPSPSSSPSPSASDSPSPTPTATPSEPPVVAAFELEVCPLTGEPVAGISMIGAETALDIPDGMSAIRFKARALLVIALLNVRIDDQLVTLETVGDGSAGDIIVSPGTHTWSISNAADTEVLASGVIDCPVCNPATASPPPAAPPQVPDTALPLWQGVALTIGLAFMALGLLVLLNARAVARRQ